MARKVHIVLEDDLDGTPAAETVAFSLDGTAYEVDLSEANARRMREVLAPYVGVARKAGRGEARRAGRGSGSAAPAKPKARSNPASDVDPVAVRAWARARGIQVSARGRVSAEVVKAFKDAGN